MFELERRRPLTDLQIKQRLTKLPVLEQFDFLRASDILLNKESDITLELFANLRGNLHNALINIKIDLTSNDLEDEEEKSVNDENTILSFDTSTKIGQKLASIAGIFIGGLTKSEADKTDESVDRTKQKRPLKSGRDENLSTRRSDKFAKVVTSLKDPKRRAAAAAGKTGQMNQIPELPEHEHDKQARSYLKERLYGDLGEASRREQEILMQKMKLQSLKFTSESARQQDIINERIREAKSRKLKLESGNTDETVGQLLEINKEMDDIYRKDREEHEKVLKARIEKQKKSDSKPGEEFQEKRSKLAESRALKKKRPLPILEDLEKYEADVETGSIPSTSQKSENAQMSGKKV
ncbi:unnamed protein product [Trichobilharzia szidati]|nr:unnamed protein product [Trichobilharzia szidati]